MNSLRNKVQLIGNLGQKPELILFENGTKKAQVSIATHESYKNTDGEKVETTHWHKLVAWGKQAELMAEHMSKGQEIAIEGKLITRSYDDKKGDKRTITEVQINEFLFLGRRADVKA